MGVILRIVAPSFVAGVCYLEGSDVAYRVAPIVHYMRGWTPARVRGYVARRGWRVERLEDEPRQLPLEL